MRQPQWDNINKLIAVVIGFGVLVLIATYMAPIIGVVFLIIVLALVWVFLGTGIMDTIRNLFK